VRFEERRYAPSGNIVVIIPTRNRGALLRNVLEMIRNNHLLPICTIVVDSSDIFEDISHDFVDLGLKHIYSPIKSAAIQRNVGIQKALEIVTNFDFVSFLDDDIEINPNYFEKVSVRLSRNPDFIGISGIAMSNKNSVRKENCLTSFIGLTGRPGSLTRAVINISPSGLEKFEEVDWLIGCSVWRKEVIDFFQFEPDFEGQSLFEDVIFSYRARVLGKIGCDPRIELKHLFSSQERPGTKDHYTAWVVNRFRIFKYTSGEFSKMAFWFLNVILLIVSLAESIYSKEDRLKSKGLIIGFFRIMFPGRSS
jgi:glycosyltransferase involved in cell wall biosynthesis